MSSHNTRIGSQSDTHSVSDSDTESEGDLIAQCLAALRSRGCFVWRQNSGAFVVKDAYGERTVRCASVNGISDVIGVMPHSGRLIAIETKMPGRMPTTEQRDFLDAVRRRNGLVLVCYDVRDLVDLIDRELRKIA